MLCALVVGLLLQAAPSTTQPAAPADPWAPASSTGGTIVFESEALESVPSGWKARETYEVVSPDELVETFELASGGGPYEVYSKARFKRVRRPFGTQP